MFFITDITDFTDITPFFCMLNDFSAQIANCILIIIFLKNIEEALVNAERNNNLQYIMYVIR